MTTNQDPMRLRGYTTAQLIEELVRRENGRETSKPKHWCHDCTNYVTWIDGKTPSMKMPEDYNPCQKRHEMKFMVPEDYGDEYGFYRRVCADRDMMDGIQE